MLTIGIPTYNRVETIAEHTQWLIEAGVHGLAEVLIMDNCSPDGTYTRLGQICDGTPIRVLKNSENLGLQGNFVRLFEECNTEYLIVTSDEDPVIPAHLSLLGKFLKKTKPLMVSPQVWLHRSSGRPTLYRGKRKSNRISCDDFRNASFYMSGITYSVQDSRKALGDIRAHMLQTRQLYPQVVLAAELLVRGPCFWWNKAITEKRYQLPKCFGTVTRDRFNHVSARWGQHKQFVDFLDDRIRQTCDQRFAKIRQEMLRTQQESLIHNLRHAIAQERPELLLPFDRGARSFYRGRSFKVLAKGCVRVVRSPLRPLRNARSVLQRDQGS